MFRVMLISMLALGAAAAAHADHGRRDPGDRWQGRHRDRVVVLPPRGHGFRPAPPPPGWYPGWREPWRHGYRYRAGDRYRFVAPGRPAVELSLVFPLY